MADRLKEIKKTTAIAKLNDVPTSPRKMRLVADMIRGVEVNHALDILKYTKREASIRLEKLLRSAIANWEAKNEGARKELEDGNVLSPTGKPRTKVPVKSSRTATSSCRPSWSARVLPSSVSAQPPRAAPDVSASAPTM